MTARDYYQEYWTPSGFNPKGSTHKAMIRRLAGLVRPGLRCLDIGCGDGRTAGLWLRAQGCAYVGVDISANAVAQAKEEGLDARVIEDAAHLPFDDASFDLVVCIEVLEHLFLPNHAAAEARRVLAPGGVFFATVPNVMYWRRRMDAIVGRWNPMGDNLAVEQPWRDPHIRFFTARTLGRMITQSGFQDVRVRGHAGAFVRDIPLVGRHIAGREATFAYRFVERLAPSLFGMRLDVTGSVARREPATSSGQQGSSR